MLSCTYIKRESDKKSGRKTKKNVPYKLLKQHFLSFFFKERTCAKKERKYAPAKRFTQHFFFLEKRKPVLKEKKCP
jgi:hypothetical protein